MQKFLVSVEITVNTIETVSPSEITGAVQDLLDDFDGGNAEVKVCTEIP
jgi:hypothetical protein